MFRPLQIVPAVLLVVSTAPCFAQSEAPAADYKLHPGDQISISVWGFKELSPEPMVVRPDGMITYPTVGDIYVSGMTPSSVAKVLTAKVGQFVKNPRVTVSLLNSVAEKYYVTGPVGHAGAFGLVTGTGVREAVAAAGDLSIEANDKTASILRGDKVIPVDLAGAMSGDTSKNVQLQAGDTLKIDQALITITGAANSTGKIPLRRGATVSQAVAAVGGVRPEADVEHVQVIRGGIGGQTITANLRDITSNPSHDIALQPDDIIKVDAAEVRNVPVFITGAVGKQGQYRYLPGFRDTLSDAVSWAGGPVGDADVSRVKVRHATPGGEFQETIVDLRTAAGRDMRLQENDFIELPHKKRSGVANIASSLLSGVAALFGIVVAARNTRN